MTRPHGSRSMGSPRLTDRQIARARLTTMTAAPVAMKIASANRMTAPIRANASRWRRLAGHRRRGHGKVDQGRPIDDREDDQQPHLAARPRQPGGPDRDDDEDDEPDERRATEGLPELDRSRVDDEGGREGEHRDREEHQEEVGPPRRGGPDEVAAPRPAEPDREDQPDHRRTRSARRARRIAPRVIVRRSGTRPAARSRRGARAPARPRPSGPSRGGRACRSPRSARRGSRGRRRRPAGG